MSCRVFVVGLAYSALFLLLPNSLYLLHVPYLYILVFMLAAAHGIVIGWYAVREQLPGSRLGYFGALLLGSILVDLEAVVGIAAHETDLPAYISVVVYYAVAAPAYFAGYFIFSRKHEGRDSALPSAESCNDSGQYCSTVVFLLGFAAVYAIVVAEVLPVLIGPINVGPPEHVQRLTLIYEVLHGVLLALYAVVAVRATLAAGLSFLEAVEAILATLYPMTLVCLGYAIWWSAWSRSVEVGWSKMVLLHGLAAVALFVIVYAVGSARRPGPRKAA